MITFISLLSGILSCWTMNPMLSNRHDSSLQNLTDTDIHKINKKSGTSKIYTSIYWKNIKEHTAM